MLVSRAIKIRRLSRIVLNFLLSFFGPWLFLLSFCLSCPYFADLVKLVATEILTRSALILLSCPTSISKHRICIFLSSLLVFNLSSSVHHALEELCNTLF